MFTLVGLALALHPIAHAELSPAESEPGFRIYDIAPAKGGSSPNPAGRSSRSSSDNQDYLLGKLLVVGNADIVVGGVTWAAGSNYWFWSKNPEQTGQDPCSGEPRARMSAPTEPPDFAVTVAVDGTKGNGGHLSVDGILPGTSCRPEHAARGPSRLFSVHNDYKVKDKLNGSNGRMYQMDLVSAGERGRVGYAYHDPAAPDFGDPGRFGWILESATPPSADVALTRMAGLPYKPSLTEYRHFSAANKGILNLSKNETLIFTRMESRPEDVRGVTTVDLLLR